MDKQTIKKRRRGFFAALTSLVIGAASLSSAASAVVTGIHFLWNNLTPNIDQTTGSVEYSAMGVLESGYVEAERTAVTPGTCVEKASATWTASKTIDGNTFTDTHTYEYDTDPNNHSITEVAAKAATCTEKGNTAHYKCTLCGKLFSDSEGTTEITADSIEEPFAHTVTEVAAKTATCTEKGNKAHYKCTKCGKLFSDLAGTTEITAESVETPIDPDNHDWENAMYGWSVDFSSCTASHVCKRNASHTESEDGIMSSYVSKTPSNGQPGVIIHVATFTKLGTTVKAPEYFYDAEQAQTKRTDIEPLEPIVPPAYIPPVMPAETPAATTAAETTTTAETTAPPEETEDSDADTLAPADEEPPEEEDKFAFVDNAEEGDTITVSMGDDTVLPAEVLDEIKGKDIDLVIELENGVTWTINGTSIKGDVADINLNVSFDDSGIPVDVINKVTGERYAIAIHLDYDGEFGFEAVMTIDLQKENAGYYANLFYYDPQTNELDFVGWDIISEDGTADLLFTHASDYTIIIDDKPLDGSADETAAAADEVPDEVPDPEPVTEENPNTGITGSGLGVLVSAAVIALSRKRRTR